MNILHFKYAVEIAKTQSISKAAANLYMGQPNLSRAIKELEEELGVTVFARTTRGINVTPEGEEFLKYAKKILAQIEEIENIYKKDLKEKQKISLSTSRVTYVSYALAEFAKSLDLSYSIDILYKETNSFETISNVVKEDFNLGIIRYQKNFDKYFKNLFEEKRISYEVIADIQSDILVSKSSPLANKDEIETSELSDSIEIFYADPYVPTVSFNDVIKAETSDQVNKHIRVFERATLFDLLDKVPNTFTWTSKQPRELLEKYNLVQVKVKDDDRSYRDVLIHKNDYKLSEIDKCFVTYLCESKRKYIQS